MLFIYAQISNAVHVSFYIYISDIFCDRQAQ